MRLGCSKAQFEVRPYGSSTWARTRDLRIGGELPFACKHYKRCSRVPATQPSPRVEKGAVGLV